MIRHAFLTVTDRDFFPGTLATVNSVLHLQPNADVFAVQDENRSLTDAQARLLQDHSRVSLQGSSRFQAPGRHMGPWELKAYAAYDLCADYDVIIGIDSDCLLCSNVDAEIRQCHASGGFLGGRDGDGADYDDGYRAYGIVPPARNSRYMSTSLYFCAVNEINRGLLKRWAECCSRAIFNGTGPHAGHGDQGVLNALLFAHNCSATVELLENALWSQHWIYWTSIIGYDGSGFRNWSAGGQLQRSFHCGGAEKFWARQHRDRVIDGNALQAYAYVWFLAMLWFGECRRWSDDPLQYLAPESHHLASDLVHFLPQIFQVYPAARGMWDQLSDVWIDRLLCGIPRALSLGGGSMSEVIALVAARPGIRRYVEIGGYEGGSLLALGLRFANRDIDFYSVESFLGNLDGTMDGWPLPSRRRYLDNVARFPGLRVRLIPGESSLAAHAFEPASIDFLFIDGCHDTAAVLRDIDVWLPKVAPGGIVAGDDFGWESVRRAVVERFGEPQVTPSGAIWWLQVPA
jgi:hypothetical protein